MCRTAVVLCLLVGWLPHRAHAEEDPPPATDSGPPLRIVLPAVVQVEKISDSLHGKAFALVGSIEFERAGIFSVRAQQAVIWLDPRVDEQVFKLIDALKGESRSLPIWAVRAIYAEGGRVPALFQAGGRIVRASSLYYDFRAHEGVFVDAELRLRRDNVGPLDQGLPDLLFRAKKMRATGPGRWSARDVVLSSTDYVHPEVEIRVKRLRIENEEVSAALGRIMLLTLRAEDKGGGVTEEELEAVAEELSDPAALQGATTGEITGARAYAFRIPFFGWKTIKLQGDQIDNLIVRVDAGRIQSIGSGVYVGAGKKTKPIGWYVGAGYIFDRGPLFDTEIWVDAFEKRLTGKTIGSYMHSRGTDFDGFLPPDDRFWVQNRYRYELTDRLRFDAELTFLSDRNWLRVYNEREFKEGKDQESLGYLRYRNDVLFGTLIYKWRSIDFLETKEQLPAAATFIPNFTLLRLGEDGQGRPILLQVGLDAELGNLNFRQAEDSLADDFRTARLDIDPTLFVAFNVGAVRFTPFGRFRFTGYEEILDGSSEARYAGSAGVRADMQFGRWFGDVQHVVNLAVEYEDLYNVTTPADEIFQMDEIDAITPWEGLGIRMRNRFMKREGGRRREFLNFDLFYTWFPEERAPLGVVTDGFVELDMEWFPSYLWKVDVRGQYDYGDGRLATGSIDGRYIPHDDLSFWASVRHLDEDSDVITGGAEFMVDERWRFVLFSQIDIRNDEALDQALLIQRMGQTFMIGVNMRYKVGENRFTFSIKFDLLERFRSEKRKAAAEDLRREVFFPEGR